ncbi:type II toxin-antitoxin system VapC family toxin [Mongoliimonas terrestris]|uniref:type II toxin-antitoxin system VapC family toxin n=1 Tax=Mongoliimonas terrestris TaxID=1709001 RepID=UPI0009498ED6|nr:type II toxin-antitoxin system VapC family toxin [Mongoliimonas terrestris]
MTILLDTNTVSFLIRQPTSVAAARLRAVDQSSVAISILVAAELRFGYRRVASKRIEHLVEAFLATYAVIDWSEPADRAYAELRADLHRRGALIGPMDMLIAAHALALDAVLVTDNEREFGRVVGLKIENWIR